MYSLTVLVFITVLKLFIFTQPIFCLDEEELVKLVPTLFAASRRTASLKNNYPYLVRGYRHFCTGSILNEVWILTAGHCLTRYIPAENIVADVGSTHLSNKNGTRHQISKYYIHPQQSQSTEIYKNDIALVRLQEPIDLRFTENVEAVHFGSVTYLEEISLVASGWGRFFQNDRNLRREIRFQLLKTVGYEECRKMHAKRHNLVDKDQQICAIAQAGESLCFGDSGGPLFDLRTGYQVGVFSSMEDCSGEYPLLFTKIDSYLDWINDVTKLNLTLN